ncbi:hypothetical protein [Streptomyces sp. NPDC093589]|uniref:hypothetical protein n=1 Tax=Streptomyces sp. NPDC093589 TaxID=3366043 RepID=UPI00380DDB11
MISQNGSAVSHSNEPAPWGPYAAIVIALAALPTEQLQHLEAVLVVAGSVGNLIRMHLGER